MKKLTNLISLVFVIAWFPFLDSPGNPADRAPSSDAQECLIQAEGDLDTMLCGRCGDGFCAATCGENALTCPRDCGTTDM